MMLPEPAAHFRWVDTDYGPALVCTPLERVAAHLFTTRSWTLGSALPGDASPWDEVAHAMDVGRAKLVRLHQVHGATIVVRRVGELRDVNHLPDADIVMTDDPSLALAIQTADCVPLLIADQRTGVVAAVHAGWRGLAAGAPREAIDGLAQLFDVKASDLLVAAGPSISAARYEVGRDVYEKFVVAGFDPDRWFLPGTRPDHWQFDGWRATRDQLEACGVPSDRIFMSELCTATYPEVLCSYRREWKDAGRMAAVIRARTLR